MTLFIFAAAANNPSYAEQLPPNLQRNQPVFGAPQPAAQAPAGQKSLIVRKTDTPEGYVDADAADQKFDGPWWRGRGRVRITTPDMELKADEIDYNRETEYAEARGNVYFKHLQRNEEVWAERAEYFVGEERGKFYNVRGSLQARIDARPGILSSTNPFYFQGKWAERIGEKYLLHDGMITNCRIPRPWWTLTGPLFDIVPNDRAIAQRALFRLKKVPLFYAPYFYKSLEKLPRRSGFLTPNFGNSSRRGLMFAEGYYWVINRSHDLTYRAQIFTARGVAHHLDLRGKPRAGTDYNVIVYGVNDRGLDLGNGQRRYEGGGMVSANLRSELGKGFHGRAEINYLSSLTFRSAFTESFQEAVFSETASTGFVGKQWKENSFHVAFTRIANFQFIQPPDRIAPAPPGQQSGPERVRSPNDFGLPDEDQILIRRLPEISFVSRDRRVSEKILPVWVSLGSSVSLLHRSEPTQLVEYQDEEGAYYESRRLSTGQFMERFDLRPRISTALRWKQIHLFPSFSIRETHYGQSLVNGTVEPGNIRRTAREFSVELVPPSLERTFRRKSFMGDEVKHIIEPRVSFRHVAGVLDFNRIIRFDETDLMSNTTEAEVSLTNRIWVKRKGVAYEAFTWQIWQRRYFDPDFGGAIIPGQRNVLLSSVELTPYSFLDRIRNYSPIVSAFRAVPRSGLGVEWRSDYDPLLAQWVNSSISADARLGAYFFSAGHSYVRSTEVLSPKANQLRSAIGIGMPNRKGWNTVFSMVYDFRLSVMQYATTEVAYNTDCCGFSVQYRRFSFGSRNENQFRVAFAIANVGSFGTLRKQEKMF
ncbi:MAG: LPS-assembly protein LptD [Bryobacteraceae bacterium]